MDHELQKSTGKYRTYAFALLFITILTLYMLYIQSYAQLSQNTLLSTLEYPRPKVSKYTGPPESSPKDTASKYLISTSKCRIPNLDPFNDDVRLLYKRNLYVHCTKAPLLSYVTVNGSQALLHINQSAIPYYSEKMGVSCCYSSVTRKTENKSNPDKYVKVSRCRKFEYQAKLKEDIAVVECRDNVTKKRVYQNVHAAITIKENVSKKMEMLDNKHLSVLFIGIDSVSRLNFMREMPETRNFLTKSHWLELRAYNKMADNTFPNLLAILSGKNESTAYNTCKPTIIGSLDKCNMIWYDYRNLGYITAYAEDEAQISTFNYNEKKGFVNPPTDYYFRPYFVAAEHQLETYKLDDMTYCTGPETSGERILNLARDFAEKFQEHPYFGFFWMNTFSHNRLNSVSRMDNKTRDFLKDLWKKQMLHNTVVVFFSDHGLRFGEIRYTRTGWLEERLPILFLSLPEWFKQTYPEKYRNLVLNQDRLTTPYDVYMTLQELLVISGKNYSVKPSSGCPKCKSLFEETEMERSCEDASIEQHWCTCGGYVDISVRDPRIKSASKYILDKIHEIINSDHRDAEKCRGYTVKEVKSASISENNENWYKNDTYLLLVLQTIPEAVFEATVSVVLKNNLFSFEMQGSISRLDYYQPHSQCVDGANLKKYCYCKR